MGGAYGNRDETIKGATTITLIDQLYWTFSKPIQNLVYSVATVAVFAAVILGPGLLDGAVGSTEILLVIVLAIIIPASIQAFGVIMNLFFIFGCRASKRK